MQRNDFIRTSLQKFRLKIKKKQDKKEENLDEWCVKSRK